MKCPNCGCEIQDPSFRFCPNCRTPLPKEQSTGQTCPHCGTTHIDPSFRFCPNCRTPLYQEQNPGQTCPNCGTTNIDPSFRFCPTCHSPLKSEGKPVRKEKGADDLKADTAIEQGVRARERFSYATGGAADLIKGKAIWKIMEGEIARHITPRQFEEISDCNDGVIIEQGTSAIIYVDGQEVAQLESGLYTFATKEVMQKVTEQVLKEENKEKGNLISRTLGRVVRFFMGTKKGEVEKKEEERKNRIRTITRRITEKSVVSVYLKADGEFPGLFGAEPKEDGSLEYKPYRISTANMEVEVGVNLRFRIADFKEFIADHMQGKDSVRLADIQKAADPVVRAILRRQLRDVAVDERGIPDQELASIKANLTGVQDGLRGIEITRVIEINTDNADFERFRSIDQRLYVSDREFEYMVRTNEFQNRLTVEANRQRVTEARTDIELQAALDEVNKDHLLHDEEMEKFYQHYRNLQAIRQATGDLELEKALLGLKGDTLVAEDDYEAVEEGLRNKKFERGQLSEVLRMRSLANTSLAKMNIDEELASAEIRHVTSLRKAEINSQSEIDDVAWEAHKKDMHRNAEDVDLEGAIYGRKFVLEKQQLADAIELAGMNDQRRIREADVENELLDRRLAGQQKEKDQAFAEKVREYEFQHGMKADDIQLERMRREVEYDFERGRKFDEDEILAREQARSLEAAMKIEELERLKDKDGYLHEENMLEKRSKMSDAQLAADQLRHLTPEAQAAFMESLKSKKEAELLKENEARRQADELERIRRYDEERKAAERARAEDREYTKYMMDKIAGIATGNAAAQAAERKAERESYERIATHRIGEVDSMKEEYKDQMRHEQARLDGTTDKALNYTAQVSSAAASAGKDAVDVCPVCKGPLYNGFCPTCGWSAKK